MSGDEQRDELRAGMTCVLPPVTEAPVYLRRKTVDELLEEWRASLAVLVGALNADRSHSTAAKVQELLVHVDDVADLLDPYGELPWPEAPADWAEDDRT